MRPSQSWLLAAALCLLPVIASANITRISPSVVPLGQIEEFVTLHGTNLLGTESMMVTIDGPAGQFEREVNSATNEEVTFWVPAHVAVTAGTYTVTLTTKNFNEAPRTYGPISFVVAEVEIPSPPLLAIPEDIVVEAESRDGATVEFTVAAINIDGTPADFTCNRASGVNYPLGNTRVTCTATNEHGSVSDFFFIVVVDTVKPELVLPEDISTDNKVVTFEVSALDAVDGALEVHCSPGSGTTFKVGRTRVRCSATDAHANTAEGSFNVNVSGGEGDPPVLTVPRDRLVLATGPEGAFVEYTVSATNGGVITCEPESGTVFPLGGTDVFCVAENLFGADTGQFTILVADRTDPILILPDTIFVEATSRAATAVTFEVRAIDAVDGTAPVVCDAESGDEFPFGTTRVNCTAQDLGGNDASGFFEIVIRDTTKPVVTAPARVKRQAVSPAGAVATFTATATDNLDGARPVTCTPPSGSTFALGTTLVECTAADLSGNVGTATIEVIVRDTLPPMLIVPGPITAEATSADGAVVTFTATATDLADPAPVVTCTPPSGSTFPLGLTVVQCVARDASGNESAPGSFTVTVSDTVAPHVTSATATPAILSPPNHALVNVAITVVATDAVDAAPASRIVAVRSNQPENGTGDGDTAPDWVITGPLTLQLRAERAGTLGDRIYTITIETTDFSGNSVMTEVTVTVPQGSTRRRAVG
jgi:hypothetical protein